MLDSRPARDNEAIRRRRECENCGRRFTTFEAPEMPRLMVVKRNGAREELRSDKIFNSMSLACRKRPVSMEVLRDAVERIEREVLRDPDEEISSSTIGRLVLEELREIDTVAFVRFASVYRDFQTIADFKEIIETVRKQERLVAKS